MPKGSETFVNEKKQYETRATGTDESAVAVAKSQEASDKKRAAAIASKGGEVDDRPKALPGEDMGTFSARMSAYRKKKQAAQASALK